MNIDTIMSKKLITLSMDCSLGDAKSIFEQHPIHHLPVLDESKKLIGLLNDRDLYKHLSPSIGTAKETHQDLAMLKKPVNLIMTRDLITAPSTLKIKEALVWIDEHHISCLPVVDDGKLVGIVSWRDVIKVLAEIQRRQID